MHVCCAVRASMVSPPISAPGKPLAFPFSLHPHDATPVDLLTRPALRCLCGASPNHAFFFLRIHRGDGHFMVHHDCLPECLQDGSCAGPGQGFCGRWLPCLPSPPTASEQPDNAMNMNLSRWLRISANKPSSHNQGGLL